MPAWLGLCLVALLALRATAVAEPLVLRVIGGLQGTALFERHERGFWRDRIGPATMGALAGQLASSEASGLSPAEVMASVVLGAIDVGTIQLGPMASEHPELLGPDLPFLNTGAATARRALEAWRPRMEATLRAKGLEPLGFVTYPPQLIQCRDRFRALSDLTGRRIRTPSAIAASALTAVGARPVSLPFAQSAMALRAGVVDCAVTVAASGAAIGLHPAARYVAPRPVTLGISVIATGRLRWAMLPAAARRDLADALAQLEDEVWQAAGQDAEAGLRCATGDAAACGAVLGGTLPRPVPVGIEALVPPTAQDTQERQELLLSLVLPEWFERCGAPCEPAWSEIPTPVYGLHRRQMRADID